VRHESLLPAMTISHVGRAKPPMEESAFTGWRRLLSASVVLPCVAIIAAIIYVTYPQAHDDIETVIRQAGFDPLTPPPSRLRGPGALYTVENGIYEKVCKEPAIAAEKLQVSPSMDRNLRRLENGGFSLAGDIVEAVNAKLSGARLTSIEYKLTNVTISEIPGDDLLEIQKLLLKDPHCEDIVQTLLKENKRICAGASVISATTSYRIQVDQRFDSGVQDQASVVKAVQKAVEAEGSGHIQVRSEDELVGENLFLGIRLQSFCIVPDTATEPALAPQPEARSRAFSDKAAPLSFVTPRA
jgi:hypothetical protein